MQNRYRDFITSIDSDVFHFFAISYIFKFIIIQTILIMHTQKRTMTSEYQFINIGSFSDTFQANFAKEILLSNGITCRIVGDAFQIIETSPAQKISLEINSEDFLKAKELLEIYFEL